MLGGKALDKRFEDLCGKHGMSTSVWQGNAYYAKAGTSERGQLQIGYGRAFDHALDDCIIYDIQVWREESVSNLTCQGRRRRHFL